MSSISAILFDAGGTLIHVDGRRVCRAAGVPFSEEAFTRAETAAVGEIRALLLSGTASTDAERFPRFLDVLLERLGAEGGEERLRAARRVREEHARRNLWSRAGAGAAETLEALRRRGYRLGVVSNADGRVRRLLRETGLSGFLEVVVDSAEAGVEKPDPGIFLAAVGHLGLEPSQCAYVGDIYEIDVLGARAAGLSAVMIGAGPAPEPVTRVGALADLLDLFPGR